MDHNAPHRHTPRRYEPPDLRACQEHARPWLEAARAVGDTPRPGTGEWLALDAGDPRKHWAILRAGLARIAEDAELPRALAQQLREADREAASRLRQASHDLSAALSLAKAWPR